MDLGAELPAWTILPFVAMLLSIALLPLATPHFWERNLNKALVAALISIPLAAYLVGAFGHEGVHQLREKAQEYVSFLLLLLSLFVITGGIVVRGSLSGTPILNTAILGLGGLIASLIGTTGASVLLIRPLLRANAPRERKVHIVVFFIFIVSNCGGLLTPLGDPPLFLGFLKGVPFEWTLSLWEPWLVVNGALLLIFSLWDQQVFNAEEAARPGSQLEEVMHHEPLSIDGKRNFLLLAGVVLTIFAAGRGLGSGGAAWPYGVQEALMVLLALVAYLVTPQKLRDANHFSWGPIVEVAVLFAGIFVTMAPALLILNEHAADLGIRTPLQFYWATGLLSSFLDNAPTYLTFAAAGCGLHGIPVEGFYLRELLALGAEGAELLAAISCGAVMMGANTYIGNGPNFMVKAIAESAGVRMPSFFGYMAYSCGVLIPLFIGVSLLFFR